MATATGPPLVAECLGQGESLERAKSFLSAFQNVRPDIVKTLEILENTRPEWLELGQDLAEKFLFHLNNHYSTKIYEVESRRRLVLVQEAYQSLRHSEVKNVYWDPAKLEAIELVHINLPDPNLRLTVIPKEIADEALKYYMNREGRRQIVQKLVEYTRLRRILNQLDKVIAEMIGAGLFNGIKEGTQDARE
jgi:hypothetical protein